MQKAIVKRRTWVAGIVALILVSISMAYMRQWQRMDEAILSGELTYTCNCGWISWDHARPEGLAALIQAVVKDTSSASKEISYSQKMQINLPSLKIVREVVRKYRVTGYGSPKQREELAWVIFQQTSESFEAMQGRFLGGINSAIQNSSFKEGDLTGNRIAFYKQLEGYDNTFITDLCQPVSILSSMALYKSGKYGKNSLWYPIYRMPHGIYPKELEKIGHDSTFLKANLRFVSEECHNYLD